MYSAQNRFDKSNLQIINVSSGDGELVYLNSNLQSKLAGVKSIGDWSDLITTILNNFDSSYPYAYGDSPMYSLSKALLNVGTQILHRELFSSTSDVACSSSIRNVEKILRGAQRSLEMDIRTFASKDIKSQERHGKPMHNGKALSVCPGNFLSPMSTEEEILDSADVNEVAKVLSFHFLFGLT